MQAVDEIDEAVRLRTAVIPPASRMPELSLFLSLRQLVDSLPLSAPITSPFAPRSSRYRKRFQ
ncbi:hypothetical protein HMPREF9004_1650 [Schaalia cardiffensis F0333]|uniref:Uncharacterized protein n=1 Tax=Schaalia cardiffensis F0333 TaxID=888050 RepID=N6W5I5_9ACTO|nr:hypothetical protein HMPREF9004_1650 [Schaalia cardiffensis F0333]